MKNSLFLQKVSIHPDWFPFLNNDLRELVMQVEVEVTNLEFTPVPEKVLRFLSVPLFTSKIIILGQDPYPQPGVATGRAFEVGTLKSWHQPFKNISLKNILRAIYKSYSGEVILFSQLKEKIGNEFPVLPPDKLFSHWESQGILLLNTSLTCQPGNPGSHQKLWQDFSNRLLKFISEQAPHLSWFIWGNHAKEATKKLTLKHAAVSRHPMMCHDIPGREDDFLYGAKNCFEPFVQEIDWTGYAFMENKNRHYRLF